MCDEFDLQDPEERELYQKILKVDYWVLEMVIRRNLSIIRETLDLESWESFRKRLNDYEKRRVFKWKDNSIGIKWRVLQKKSSRYYQVHRAIERAWMEISLMKSKRGANKVPLTNLKAVIDHIFPR